MPLNSADLRIVIIEDETDSALVVRTTLQLAGAQTWIAQSAEDGLALLAEVAPNLLLVDLALPGMDGWGFIQQVRSDPRFIDIPAVVVSGYATRTVAQKALEAGFAACLGKPIDTSTLVQQLTSIVENSSLPT